MRLQSAHNLFSGRLTSSLSVFVFFSVIALSCFDIAVRLRFREFVSEALTEGGLYKPQRLISSPSLHPLVLKLATVALLRPRGIFVSLYPRSTRLRHYASSDTESRIWPVSSGRRHPSSTKMSVRASQNTWQLQWFDERAHS